MAWINPPETIRRFTLHQRIQHWAATAIAAALIFSAALSHIVQGAWPGRIHIIAGLGGAGLFLYHVIALVAIGIRNDVPMRQVAFLPSAHDLDGKYVPEERKDYLNLLACSFLLSVTGIFLRWPGRLGVSGMEALSWLRVMHAGCGAACVVHLFTVHVNARWFRSPASFRRAILHGTVPLADAEIRAGWIADLVSSGILVPAPFESLPEERRESQRVRRLLEEGNRLARDEDYDRAAGAFAEALEIFPGYSQAMFNLGVARMKQGRSDLAGEQFRKFIETDPFNPMAQKARELLLEIARERDGDSR